MKNKLVLPVLVLVLLCVTLWGGYAQGQRGNSMRQTWEYKVIYLDTNANADPQLNQLGKDGWELVGVTFWNQWFFYHFKRAK